nr:hypothetical protein [Nitrospinaceae bacterium]
MKESAHAALSYVRSKAKDLGIEEENLSKNDLHIHVPAGAIPKDGPSAGITMATAIASALTGKPIDREIAMTGEVTLRGRVLPIGGLKEKALAAKRFGIHRIIVPLRNKKDLDDMPEYVKKDMEFIFAEDLDQVFEVALPLKKRLAKKKPTKTKHKAKTSTKVKAKVKTKAKTKIKAKAKTKTKASSRKTKKKATAKRTR